MGIMEKIRNRRRERLKRHYERYRRIHELLQKYGDDIIHSDNFQMTKRHIQHGNMTVNDHCLSVARYSLILNKKLRLHCNQRDLIRGSLLHDYFLYDWHDKGYVPERKRLHGFWHPGIALRNADKEYQLTDIQRDIIRKHMWPLTVVPPVCRESWVVTSADKYCSLMETLKLHKGHGKRYDFAAAKQKRDKERVHNIEKKNQEKFDREKQLEAWERTGNKAAM